MNTGNRKRPEGICREAIFCWQGKSRAKENLVLRLLQKNRVNPARAVLTYQGNDFKLAVYLKSQVLAEKIQRKASPLLRPHGISFASRGLKKKDWLFKWNEYFHIQPLGKKFVIVPMWERKKYPQGLKGKRAIYIDPRGDFGSGTHATTRLVVLLMEELEGRFRDFFDIGTGTGILSLAAAKLGAKSVSGIDLHAHSVQTARLNLRANRVSGRIFRRNIRSYREKNFDLVCANLLSRTLLENKKKILGLVSPEKWLIVSGIGRQHLKNFRKNFKDGRFRCLKILQRNGWGALLYRRRPQ